MAAPPRCALSFAIDESGGGACIIVYVLIKGIVGLASLSPAAGWRSDWAAGHERPHAGRAKGRAGSSGRGALTRLQGGALDAEWAAARWDGARVLEVAGRGVLEVDAVALLLVGRGQPVRARWARAARHGARGGARSSLRGRLPHAEPHPAPSPHQGSSPRRLSRVHVHVGSIPLLYQADVFYK